MYRSLNLLSYKFFILKYYLPFYDKIHCNKTIFSVLSSTIAGQDNKTIITMLHLHYNWFVSSHYFRRIL